MVSFDLISNVEYFQKIFFVIVETMILIVYNVIAKFIAKLLC